MAERVTPWRSKPPQDVVDMLQLVGTVQLFLVQRPGPTSFLVREEGSEVKRKVQIGSRISCTCSPLAPSGTCKELCLHTLFVMVKVLRVPVGNPLLWQLSLSDRELEEVLRCAMQPERPPQASSKAQPAAEKAPAGQVKRKEVEADDPCPICYEDMVGQDADMLVWCRFGCGSNVHGKCVGVWMEHQVQSLGKELTCPLCRSNWGDFKWRPPPPKRKAREERKDVHYGTHCGACKRAPLVGKRYRCLICADMDLCDACFSGGHHPQHPFAVKDTPQSLGAPAERPDMMPTATRITAAGAVTTSQPSASHASHTSQGPGHYCRSHSHSGQDLGDGDGEGEVVADGRDSGGGGGAAAAAAAAGGDGGGRDALAVGVVGQYVTPRQGAGAGTTAATRHPVRGTTVSRRAGQVEEASLPPSLEARLAQRRQQQQLLAVEGLTVGAAAGAPGPSVGFVEPSDVVVRRGALGQPSKPVLLRRARSTAHERQQQLEGPGGGGGLGGGELRLGLAGVQLNAAAGEAGPGPSSLAAVTVRQQVHSTIPPRHPLRQGAGVGPSQLGRPSGVPARPPLAHGTTSHHSLATGPHPAAGGPAVTASGGVGAVAVAAPDLVLQGRVALHGEGPSSGPVGRPPPQAAQLAHGRAGLLEAGAPGPLNNVHQQAGGQPQGVRFRGAPPRYPDAHPHPQPQASQTQQQLQQTQASGLRRSRSAGHQGIGPMGLGLSVTARSMAPHPLTPETPLLPAAAAQVPAAHAAPHTLAVRLPAPDATYAAATYSGEASSSLYGNGPYGAAPYGNESYGGAIIDDDLRTMLAFSHHIPGPGASFRDGEDGDEEGYDEDGMGGSRAGNTAAMRAAAAALWGAAGSGRDSRADDEFPRGPVSPHLHLFSSRPNTVPDGLGGEPYGDTGDRADSLNRSHSRSFSCSQSASQSFSYSPTRLSRATAANPSSGPSTPCVGAASASFPHGFGSYGAGLPAADAGPSPTLHPCPLSASAAARAAAAASPSFDTASQRDSVLLASVAADAMDDFMDNLRRTNSTVLPSAGGSGSYHRPQQQVLPPHARSEHLLRMSREGVSAGVGRGGGGGAGAGGGGGAGTAGGGHNSWSGGAPTAVARVGTVSVIALAGGRTSSATAGLEPVRRTCGPHSEGLHHHHVGESDVSAASLSASLEGIAGPRGLEDTLSCFMEEQRTASQRTGTAQGGGPGALGGPPHAAAAERAGLSFTTAYSNPVFNRPYTLDMSLG